ncbi:hypothetical protein AGMMS50276_07860 [Synergistales bacterium]|nr:hypothetical protein AGMMS50276_07860 [Synergistales bacterium]
MKIAKTVRFFWALLFVFLFLSAKTAFAEYDIKGRWLLEGDGYADESIVRLSLTDEGYMDIKTTVSNNVEFLTGYDVYFRINASRLGIKAWDYDRSETLRLSPPITLVNPTVSKPFKLPPVLIDDLTYAVTFTTETSGTVDIYGTIYVDYVGSVEINSVSAIWKEGTERPYVDSLASGCDGGFSAGLLGFLVLSCGIVYNRKSFL